ncbi:MAG TPA: LptA/OstA family protein [bacterium]|nr:LptA/OstA family protein [bacterium]
MATSIAVLMSISQPAVAQTALPPEQGPVTVTADHIEYDTQTGDVVADGHVVATRGSTTITADHLTGNVKTGDVQAMGHVVLTQPGRTATGESLRYNYNTRAGAMSQAVAKYAPWTVTGRTLTTTAGRALALAASATPCDPARPAFRVTAKRVVVVPDDHMTAYDAVLYVYGVPVLYVPAYTASLKKGRNARSGPTLGYDNFNGLWAEYSQYIPLGDWESQIRVLYGTRSGISGEAIIDRRFADYLLLFHLGRTITFDQGGNEFNIDQDTVEADIWTHHINGLPLSYSFGVQAGNFGESQSSVSAFRTEGLLTLTTDTISLNKSLTVSAGGYYRYDAYSTGSLRNITAASAAMSQILSPVTSATFSYNFAQVTGTTPFLFDVIGSDSVISLSYSYYPGKFFQSGTISGSYDFLTLQTTAGLNLAFAVSPSLQFATNISYNLTTQQLSEVDYAVNATCDCVALGVVYQTFPNMPVNNRWYITLGINSLPGVATSFQFGGPR